MVERGVINYQDLLRKLQEEVMEIKETPIPAGKP